MPERPRSPSLAHALPEAVSEIWPLRARLPGTVELVYDNYHALVIGFGPTERPSDTTLSVAVYPRWVNLCFLRGAELSDPENVLVGNGKIARHAALRALDSGRRARRSRRGAKGIVRCSPVADRAALLPLS